MKFILFNIIAVILFLISCSKNQNTTNENDFEKKYFSCYNMYERNRNGELDSVKICLKHVDSLIKIFSKPELYWLSNHIKGNLSLRVSDFEKTLEYFEKAKTYVKNSRNLDTLMAKSEIGISQTYKSTGNYLEAIKCDLKALSIFEKYNITSSINKAKASIANLYFLKGDSELAKKSLKNIVQNNYTIENAIPYHTLANVYGELGEIDSALYIDNKMISNLSIEKYKLLLSPFYNNKALCYLFLKKSDSALYYFRKSYCIDSLNNNQKNMGVNLLSIADIYAERGNDLVALKNYNNACLIFKKHHIKRELKGYYQQLSDFFIKKGNYKDAMLYKDSANLIIQEIDNLSLNTKIELLQIEHETQIKDHLIEQQNQKIYRQQIMVILIFLLLILGLTIYYFIYKYNQNKQSLRQIQQLNQTVLETELQERDRIARDLHDSVGQKLSVVKMQLSVINSNTDTTSHILDDAIQDVRNISHNLMPSDLSKGLVEAINSMSEQINYSNKTLSVHFNVSTNINALNLNNYYSLQIYRIVQEILNNAVKYAQAKNIHINIDCSTNELHLNLSDDGVGFDIDDEKNKTGIGMKNISNRVSQLNGDVQINSSSTNGTHFKIKIPL